jgi:hypothetical protein
MKVGDVTETLNLALQASGLGHARVVHHPRLLSDNSPSYISSDLSEWLDKRNMGHVRGAPCHPQTSGGDRTLASNAQEPHLAKTIICPATSKPGSTLSSITTIIAVITRAWKIRLRTNHPAETRKDQTSHNPKSSCNTK